MPAETLDEFLSTYNPDGTHPVTEIEVSPGDDRGTSPFVIVRCGRFAAVLNPLAFEQYLDIDVHPFADGQDATAAVLGMSTGRRWDFRPPSGTTSDSRPSVHLAILLIGDQG